VIRLAFFNNKGGVGKTTLVYHLGWTFADLGMRVLLVDLDPQSNLTALSVDEDQLEALWADRADQRRTVYGAVHPIVEGIGDISEPHIEAVGRGLALLVGDIRLAGFEAQLSQAWPNCMGANPAAYRMTTAFHRLIAKAGASWRAEVALMDVGPNLGAINRSALIAADKVVTPLGADLFSIQGLRNLGPALQGWRTEWTDRVQRNPVESLDLPRGGMEPAGYVVVQPSLYMGRVTKAYERWIVRIPPEYRTTFTSGGSVPRSVEQDPLCLGVLKHYRSLMPLAHEARRPVFHLRAADGALGAHAVAAQEAGRDFRKLATRVADRIGLAGLSGQTAQ
jgi:cellulose biosynthesis protein BcsQ